MKLFSGSANKPLAEKIAKACGLSLSPVEIHTFPDKERRIRIEESVLDEDAVLILPTSPPTDENYMELFFMIDGLRRSGASSVTAVIPYMGYQRQDHIFREGEAVSISVVIRMLEDIGASKVIAFDLHSIKIAELFAIPMVQLSALPLFADKIKDVVSVLENAVLVTPDMGGIRRIKIVSELLGGVPYIAIEKNRDVTTGSIDASGIHNDSNAQLRGKSAIIVDDMISSGGTIVQACNILKEEGVDKTYIFATHAVFSQDAPSLLQKAALEKVFVTDTVFVPEEKQFEKLEVISVAPLIAETLKNS